MKVIVTGGRSYSDCRHVSYCLSRTHAIRPITLIIHGGAAGADQLAGSWAVVNGIPVKVYPADWEKHGRAAGMIRNAAMLEEKPDLVVAFPGGKGTANMVKKARRAGVEVLEY